MPDRALFVDQRKSAGKKDAGKKDAGAGRVGVRSAPAKKHKVVPSCDASMRHERTVTDDDRKTQVNASNVACARPMRHTPTLHANVLPLRSKTTSNRTPFRYATSNIYCACETLTRKPSLRERRSIEECRGKKVARISE